MDISPDDLCAKIDQCLMEFFETLAELYLEQEKLGQYMKSGYLNMSRARYNMGIKSVGMDQWDENNMVASLKVRITEDRQFTVDKGQESDLETRLDDLDLTSNEEGSRSTVRRRNVEKSVSGEEKEHIENVPVKNENTDVENDFKKKNGSEKTTDPLKWFGILVPQSLRQSQKDFTASMQTALAVASLKIKLSELQTQYRELLRNKEKLL